MNSPDRQETILVVDDTPSTLEVLQRSLTAEGYITYTAPNAIDALSFLDGNAIDLVITDLKMPKLSGIDLIRHIRENHKNVAVMMITGYATVESAVEAVKSGAEEYVSKPFTDAELFAAVRRVLDKLKRRREGPVTNREYAEFLPQTGYKPVNGESLPEHWYADDGPQLCGFAAKFLVMRPCLRSHLSHGPSEGDEAVGPVFFRLSDTKLPAHCQWQ